jgi:endonuclease/exonuclease/phosphatase family metal-dependent hydrolase
LSEDCDNGIDDDGDSYIDCDDFDCDDDLDCGGSSEDCDNGVDDDGDGFIDCDDWDCDHNPDCDDNIEPLSSVQFRALPSITSDEFEIAIGRHPFGESIFNDTIAIVIKENHSNDFIPNEGEILTFTFDDTYHEPVELIEINKEDPELLRVMAYNTLNNGLQDIDRIDNFIRIINAINPQIIGFNETGDTSEEDVNDLLETSLGGTWYVLKHEPENITASRFPILDEWDVNDRIKATLIDLDDEIYNSDILFIVGHLSCCANDIQRQQQADRFIEFILDAKNQGGEITVSEDTPIVFLGDMNLVGDSQQYYTIIEGNIQNTDIYGVGGFPDWDNSELEDIVCRQTDKRMAYTWRYDNSEYPPGRLDFIFYTNSVMSTAKSFTLQTEIMSEERLENYGLLWNDTKGASDHFPIVADFDLSFNVGCSLNGDINNDGSIDIVDIVTIVDYILNSTDIELECADINNDGDINVVDVVQLVNLILN